jgi:hypothetical protein
LGLFVLAILVVVSSSGYSLITIYDEDFSSDPNFTLPPDYGDGDIYEWDPINEIYRVRIFERDDAYKWAHSPEFEWVENTSFEIQFDLKLIETSWGMQVGIKFFNSVVPDGASALHIWHKGSHDPRFAGHFGQTGFASENTWYTFKINYDHSAGMADFLVTERETQNMFYENLGMAFNPVGFNMVAVGDHTYNWDSNVGEIHYDNISVNKATMCLMGFGFLSVLGIVIRQRRKGK